MKHFNSVEDIAADSSFKRWVVDNDPQSRQYWLDYLALHPEKKPLVEDAYRFLQELSQTHYRLSEQQLQVNWVKIEADLPSYSEAPLRRSTTWRPQWYYLAASLAALALGAAFWFYGAQRATQTYKTAYGETQQVVLPDGSLVTLSANSSLKYQQHENGREVWLQGEGFFEVLHTSDDQSFIVHTRGPEVEVLGTAFYVNNREKQVRVVLNSGRVRVHNELQEVRMVPGELVAYQEETRRLTKRTTNPEQYSAWKDNQLVFDNTPLGEIAQLLEDRYAYEIIFEDALAKREAFTGTFPADRIHILLTTLQKSMPMVIEDRRIVFGKP